MPLRERTRDMRVDVRRAIQIMEFIRTPDATVTRRAVQDWSASDDPDVLGAAYLAATTHASRIQGGLQVKDYTALILKIYATALFDRSATDYGFDPPDSDLLVLRVLIDCNGARTDSEAKRALRAILAGVAALYKKSKGKERTRIVHGLLEHAFECPALRKRFTSWKKDPVLGRAYREADNWALTIGGEGVLAIWQAAGVLPRCCSASPHVGGSSVDRT